MAVAPRTVDESAHAILDAARHILATEGHTGLSVRRIATAAGGSTMNVYSRFGSKDGVLDALIIEGFEALGASMARVRTTSDPVADIHRCGRAYRTFALANRTSYELMFARAIPEYEMSLEAQQAAISTLSMLRRRVQRAMDAGAIRAGDALHTATLFWSACHGAVSLELKAVGPTATRWADVNAQLVAALVVGLS